MLSLVLPAAASSNLFECRNASTRATLAYFLGIYTELEFIGQGLMDRIKLPICSHAEASQLRTDIAASRTSSLSNAFNLENPMIFAIGVIPLPGRRHI